MSDGKGFSIDFESALVWFACPDRQCRGGAVGDMECRHCDGFGVCVDISTWLSNLATAAALCAAFDLGLYNTDAGNVHPSVNWRPGCRWPAP